MLVQNFEIKQLKKELVKQTSKIKIFTENNYEFIKSLNIDLVKNLLFDEKFSKEFFNSIAIELKYEIEEKELVEKLINDIFSKTSPIEIKYIFTLIFLASLKELIIFFPKKKDQFNKIFNDLQKNFNNNFAQFTTIVLQVYYSESDFGNAENKKRNTEKIIQLINDTLSFDNNNSSIFLFLSLVFSTLFKPSLGHLGKSINQIPIKDDFFIIIYKSLIYLLQAFEKEFNVETNSRVLTLKTVVNNIEHEPILKNSVSMNNICEFAIKISADPTKDHLNYNDFKNQTIFGFLPPLQTDFKYMLLKGMTEVLDNFKNFLNEKINPPIKDEPLTTTLSVEQQIDLNINIDDLGYLLRILKDLDVINKDIEPAIIAKVISPIFRTKGMRKTKMNSDGLKNHIFTKSPKSIEKMHSILKKMQQIAFDDKKNIGHK